MSTPAAPVLTASAVRDATRYADTWLAHRRHALRVPGVQAAVWFDDELVLSGAYGVADVRTGAALTPEHLFRIASHSKTFTAVAVLQLAQSGRLRLDDAAATWLPFLAGSPIAGVTVREMLSHSGGVVRDGADSDHWQLARPFPDAEALRAVALDDAAVLPANERFKYSNITYSLLGMVIEAVSGSTYADYVTDHVVRPLGLVRTGPELDPERLGEYAAGHTALAYADDRAVIEHVDTAAMAAATGFFSTAAETVAYASAHFAGDERLLGEPAKRLMRRPEVEVGGDDGHYGLGFAVEDVGGRRLVGHGGGYPGHITRTVLDPTARLAVSVFTNAIDGPAHALAHGLVKLVDLAARVEAQPAPAVAAPEALDLYVGRFANLWGVVDVVRFGGHLLALDPGADDPTAAPTRLVVEDDATLRVTETGGYGAPGESLRYTFGADGGVQRVQGLGGMTSYPIEAFAAAMAGRAVVDLAGGGAMIAG